MLTIQGKQISVVANENTATFTVTLQNGDVWTMNGRPYVALTDGRVIYLDESRVINAAKRKSATWHGIGVDYDLGEGLILHTIVYIEDTRDDLYFENRLEGDAPGQVERVVFPAPVDFNAEAGHGYTVLPRMQGTLVPAGSPIQVVDGILFERDAYMPAFVQVRDNSGYLAIIDTPFDARYWMIGENIEFRFITSLGTMSYPRRMLYRFANNCDYNDFAHIYRDYILERGRLHTLRKKVAKNAAVQDLFGRPVIHTDIAVHITPGSQFYRPDEPEHNDHHTSFDTRAKQLTRLKEMGLEKAYLHLDGWGRHGYDNLHPDPFPPHEAAGGAEGMKRLADTTRELGYIFGIHDQYRDFYYDAPTFDLNNAIQDINGEHPYCAVWNGGAHSFLCAHFAPGYVRRNYDEFKRLGIDVKAAYLDVFSVVTLDECFNPEHPMTREQCALKRNECINILNARGIIPSSEEAVECLLESIVLCHHAPYYTTAWDTNMSEAIGVPVPFFNLVYHDCIVVPWLGMPADRGGWGIPRTDSPYAYAILNGNPVYCPVDASASEIEEVKMACASAERLTHETIVRHEFLDGTYRRQRTTWSDGTVIEVDFDTNDFKIVEP